MDAFTIATVARAAERLVDVLAGVLAVYCGYRLFALLPPTQTDSNGRFELPGVKIVFARVGPGLLFAGLGVAIIAVSLTKPIQVPENGEKGGFAYSVAPAADDVALAEQLMELGCVGQVIASPAVRYPRATSSAIESARAALLLVNWRKEWGDPDAFRRWSRNPRDGEASASVKALYFSRREKCPD